VAVPFAADFALLGPHQRWINDARFPRWRIPEYYREIHGESPGSPRIHVMYPGDVLNGDQLQPSSPYRQRNYSIRQPSERLHSHSGFLMSSTIPTSTSI
jgi:hypothetical protein